jgi:hypothetical protein
LTLKASTDSHARRLIAQQWRCFVEFYFKSKEVPMESTAPYVYINDDEIELKQIIVRYGNLNRQRKFTVSEAERRGLVKVESEPNTLNDDKFSKAIAILDSKVRLCLSTREFKY